MPVRVCCSKCGKVTENDVVLLGQWRHCPACSHRYQITLGKEAPEVAQRESSSQNPPTVSTHETVPAGKTVAEAGYSTPLRCVIVVVGILAIVAAGVYPPWQWKTTEGHFIASPTEQSSYSWLWSPPRFGATGASRVFPATLDLSRLVVEWFLIGAVTAVLAWVLPVLYKAACPAKKQ